MREYFPRPQVMGVAALAVHCAQLALLVAEEAPRGCRRFALGAGAEPAGAPKSAEDAASRLSWEPPAGVHHADSAPHLGPVVLRPRRSSLDSGGAGGPRRPNPPDSLSSPSLSSSEGAETASVHSASFVTVNLDDVTNSPNSSALPS